MKRIKSIIIVALIAFNFVIGYSQTSLSDYKYILVPSKFEFLDKADGYRLNTLTRVLFKEHGFNVIYDKQTFPDDFAANNCLALSADVINSSNFTRTKLSVELRNCKNQVVYLTKIGDSKHKEYKKAYHEALRAAFRSFSNVNYKYVEKQQITSKEISENRIEKKPYSQTVTKSPRSGVLNKELPVKKIDHSMDDKKLEKVSDTSEKVLQKTVDNKEASQSILFAQKTDKGFQLINSKGELIMVLLQTVKKDIFLVKGQDVIVFKEKDKWYKSNSANSMELLKIDF